MTEIWKDIEGYKNFYQVSNKGRVKALKKWDVNKRDYSNKEHLLNPTDNGNGYLIVGLKKRATRKNYYVHRLVAEAFIKNPNNYPVVNHIDRDKRNNNAENLEWCTQQENVLHSVEFMRKPRRVVTSNTGEKYICFKKNRNRFEVCVKKKYCGVFKSLEEAIKARNDALEGIKTND